jgi:hypothetical protein
MCRSLRITAPSAYPNGSGDTPLGIAARAGQVDLVYSLLQGDHFADAPDRSGNTGVWHGRFPCGAALTLAPR